MNNSTKKVLALSLAASMLLGACSNAAPNQGETQTETPTAPTTPAPTTPAAPTAPETTVPETPAIEPKYEVDDLVIGTLASLEMSVFNILYSQGSENSKVLVNCVDGLLEADNKGQLQPCIAESWGTEDGGKNWTFNIRKGVTWVDVNGQYKGDCTANDWVTGMEWVLNYHKNEGNNTSMPIEMIKGANEYYEYTKTLSEEEGKALTAGEGSKFAELVGVKAADDYTLKYECIATLPYFESVAIYGCLFPMHAGMVEEIGVDGVKSLNNTNMWYNGPYILTEFIQSNSKVLEKNENYWDTDSKRFNTVTTYMIDSAEVAYTLFQNGDLDHVDLTEANLNTISADKNHEYYDNMVELRPTSASSQFYFNFAKLNPDGSEDVNWNKAACNEAFRKAFYYGFDTTEYLKRINAITPMKCENNFYTVDGLAFDQNGKDYIDFVKEKLDLPEYNGETPVRYNKELGDKYKAQAKEELAALGVTFPIVIDYYIKASDQSALDSANVLKTSLEQCLGSDFVELNILTFVSSFTKEIRNSRLHALTVNGWVGDYGDPVNFVGQMNMNQENAVYANVYNYIKEVPEADYSADLLATYKEFSAMCDAASAITDDITARFEAFAEAEAYMIEHALCVPASRKVSWCLTKINPYSKMNAQYGSMNEKMKGWETSKEPYTTAEIEAIAAAYNS